MGGSSAKYIDDPAGYAVGQFQKVLDEALVDGLWHLADGQQCEISGDEAAQFFGLSPDGQFHLLKATRDLGITLHDVQGLMRGMGAETSLGHNKAETERKSRDLGHFRLGGFEPLRKREMPVIRAVLALTRESSVLGS